MSIFYSCLLYIKSCFASYFYIYSIEVIFFALSISLTSGIMLIEHIKDASLLVGCYPLGFYSPWKNYDGGIYCTSTGSEDSISITVTWFFFFLRTYSWYSGYYFLMFFCVCLTLRVEAPSFYGSAFIFFYDLLRLVSYPSNVLFLFKEVELTIYSYPISPTLLFS